MCTERVSVWLVEHRTRGVTMRFIDGDGGATTHGGGWGGHDGGVLLGDVAINLNRPVVIAALVRAAIERGWDAQTAACEFDDGFAVLREATKWLSCSSA